MKLMPPNPSGLCMCGCGQRTPLARQSEMRCGAVKGEHRRFVWGHNQTRNPVEYIVDPQTGCWVWQRFVDRHGYGQRTIGKTSVRAHRHAYEQVHGSIPSGLTIDHLCRNRLCGNPDHLEPVTHRENCRRAALARREEAQAA